MERTTSKVCAEKNKMMTVSNRISHNTTTTMIVDAVVGVATSKCINEVFYDRLEGKTDDIYHKWRGGSVCWMIGSAEERDYSAERGGFQQQQQQRWWWW
jgi:hypothetical protein